LRIETVIECLEEWGEWQRSISGAYLREHPGSINERILKSAIRKKRVKVKPRLACSKCSTIYLGGELSCRHCGTERKQAMKLQSLVSTETYSSKSKDHIENKRAENIDRIIAVLPGKLIQAVKLKYIQQYSDHLAANMIGCNESTFKKRIDQAQGEIAEALLRTVEPHIEDVLSM